MNPTFAELFINGHWGNGEWVREPRGTVPSSPMSSGGDGIRRTGKEEKGRDTEYLIAGNAFLCGLLGLEYSRFGPIIWNFSMCQNFKNI